MSSTPAAKKRRVDAATATLKKPFRSPLVNRQQQESGPKGNSSTPLRRVQNASLADADDPRLDGDRPQDADDGSISLDPPVGASPERRHKTVRSTPSTTSLRRTGSVSSLRASARSGRASGKARFSTDTATSGTAVSKPANALSALISSFESDLALRAREMRADQEDLRQAEAIVRGSDAANKRMEGKNDAQERGTKVELDADLRELIERWKGAGRIAAEEMFGIVKGRVESAGGVKAWREMRRQQTGFFTGGDDEPTRKDSEAQNDQDQDEGGGGNSAASDGDGGSEEAVADEDDDEFTMIMMLQSLNIDPDLLGWCPVEDQWK